MDIKDDKTLWDRLNLDGVGKVLLVEESYYDAIIEYVDLLKRQRELAMQAPFYQCPNCGERTNRKSPPDTLEEEHWKLYQDYKTMKAELIHYLGELKLHYSRPDSKRFCEEKIHKLKNS